MNVTARKRLGGPHRAEALHFTDEQIEVPREYINLLSAV